MSGVDNFLRPERLLCIGVIASTQDIGFISPDSLQVTTPGWQRVKKGLETSNELMIGGDCVLWRPPGLIHLGEYLGCIYTILVSTAEQTDMPGSLTLYNTQFGELNRHRMHGR